MKISTVITFVAFTTVATPSLSGPFGLERGMTLSQVGPGAKKLPQGKYWLSSVPKPHSAFERYVVQIAPQSGLCWIKAIGKNVSASAYGYELESTFAELKQKLAAIYGKPTSEHDRLYPGSIWDEPRHWMMSLKQKERVLSAFWDRKLGADVPTDMKGIYISASALSDEIGYVSVEYSFTNEDACEAEIAKSEDSSL